MDFFRRLFGSRGRHDEPDASPVDDPEVAGAVDDLDDVPADDDSPPPALPCPSCGVSLQPPPVRNRRCPRCRQPIVVRRVDGRIALLTEAAVAVFEAERRREADEALWTTEREGWLQLAALRGAAADRRARIATSPISADVVRTARDLYLAAAERSVRAARRAKNWGELGHIRREQAAALYADAGAPVPPPDEIAALHREGMTAVLRSLAPAVKHAELVSAGCCPACRKDDGAVFVIADEARRHRLPHEGCPRGLCACDWWAAAAPARRRRRTSPA